MGLEVRKLLFINKAISLGEEFLFMPVEQFQKQIRKIKM
jgi:hypothetical protein